MPGNRASPRKIDPADKVSVDSAVSGLPDASSKIPAMPIKMPVPRKINEENPPRNNRSTDGQGVLAEGCIIVPQ